MPSYHLAKPPVVRGSGLDLIGGPVVQAAKPASAVTKSAAPQRGMADPHRRTLVEAPPKSKGGLMCLAS